MHTRGASHVFGRFDPACAVAAGLCLLLCGAGGLLVLESSASRAAARQTTRSSIMAAVRPARCPPRPAVRSSRIVHGQLAPSGARWATVCLYGYGSYVRSLVEPGGPLSHALDSATSPQSPPCASVAVAPMTVVLAYPMHTRHVRVDPACAGITLQNGTMRFPLGRNRQTIFKAYADARTRGHLIRR